ncbi:MAG: NUDIX domain-containing protein [Bacteroidota bacterium]
MKIFLNDRVVEFVAIMPGNTLPSDMLITYKPGGVLQEAWLDFERYDKYKKFIVIDQSEPPFTPAPDPSSPLPAFPGSLPAFMEFVSFFKYIPAAGGLVKNEKGEFLFIHRLGFWDLPKGKIDKKDLRDPGSSIQDHESARNAAIREVKEETGLKSVTITGSLPSTWHIYTAKEKRILKQTAWFEMAAESSQPLKPQTTEGIFLVKWTPVNAIHCILTHTYASIRELLLEVVF